MKLSALALVIGVSFSGSVFAAEAYWESNTPWGDDANTAQFAQWSQINSINDTSPDAGLSAKTTGVLRETTGNGFITGNGRGGNIYSMTGTTAFVATLGSTPDSTPDSTPSGFFDVYLRIATIGEIADTSAYLNINGNSVKAIATVWNGGAVEGPFGGAAQELYWVWEDVAASSLYTFNFAAIGPHMSLDQVALATVSVSAVPEPETYSMLGLGLGLMAFAARRSSKKA